MFFNKQIYLKQSKLSVIVNNSHDVQNSEINNRGLFAL